MLYSQKACSTTPVQTATWKPSLTRPPSASAATATLTWSRILSLGIWPTVLLAAKTYGKGFLTPPSALAPYGRDRHYTNLASRSMSPGQRKRLRRGELRACKEVKAALARGGHNAAPRRLLLYCCICRSASKS